MMRASFSFDLLTPATHVAQIDAVHVQIPGMAGHFGVLYGHAPLVSTLAEGGTVVVDVADGSRQQFTVTAGVVQVMPQRVTILAEGLVK